MLHVGGKNAKKKKSTTSKRHFTVVIGNKEHGLYVSSSPSSAARKAVSKLCATDKKRKVQFSIREITQGSKKKTYGPYLGAIEKLKEPIELKGRVIRYKPVAKLDKKNKILKGGLFDLSINDFRTDESSQYKFHSPLIGIGRKKLFFGQKIGIHRDGPMKYYFTIVILSDGSFQGITYDAFNKKFKISKYKNRVEKRNWFSELGHIELYKDNLPNNEERFGGIINGLLDRFREEMGQPEIHQHNNSGNNNSGNNNSGNNNSGNNNSGNTSSIPFSIQDENLEYYHRDFKEFKSSITLYGDYHHKDYRDFLDKFIDSLYSTGRKQVIIVEANRLEEEKKNKNIRVTLFMQKKNNRNKDKKRKKLLLKMASNPKLYFKRVLTHNGKIPNTEIILGDIRLLELFNMFQILGNKSENNPNNTIDENFFNEFIRVWEEQLSILGNSEDFSEIKDEIQQLLNKLNQFLTITEFEEISEYLIAKWIYLCNLNMIRYIKQYLTKGVDIILFIGALHMKHLIEEIRKIYPVNNQNNLEENNNSNNKLNNNSTAWFHGKERIKARDMEIGKIYKIRPKNQYDDLDLYKVIEKDDEKDEIKLAKLKIPAHSNFVVSVRRPKIMKLKISDNSIYGYEYNIPPNRNTEEFSENEAN
jgi:hypothetical protein